MQYCTTCYAYTKVYGTMCARVIMIHTHGSLLVDGFDDKLFVIEGDVSDLTPGEANLGGKLVFFLIDIEPKSIHSQPQLRPLLVLDGEVVDSVHLQILCYLQILQHGIFPNLQSHATYSACYLNSHLSEEQF